MKDYLISLPGDKAGIDEIDATKKVSFAWIHDSIIGCGGKLSEDEHALCFNLFSTLCHLGLIRQERIYWDVATALQGLDFGGGDQS